MTTGEKKFQEAGAKLKAEVAMDKENAEQPKDLTEAKAKVLSQIQAITQNKELAALYEDNAEVGSENLGGSLPLLKVHKLGSSKNQLADGSEPHGGSFFYKPTGEEFKEIICHILTISRGYTAPDLQGKDKFTQLMAGVIVNDGQFKPFLIYMTGLKLSNMWDFGKVARKYTKAKPVSIPMFALTVKLTTEKKDTPFGISWLIDFEILKNPDNSPILVMDAGLFTALKDNVAEVKETIENLINSKSTEIKAEENQVIEGKKVEERGDADLELPPGRSEINNDDIPF